MDTLRPTEDVQDVLIFQVILRIAMILVEWHVARVVRFLKKYETFHAQCTYRDIYF